MLRGRAAARGTAVRKDKEMIALQLIVFGFCVWLLLYGFFTGLIRRGGGAMIRLVTLVISFVGAIFLGKALSSALSGTFVSLVQDALTSFESISSLLSEGYIGLDTFQKLIQVFVGPVMFIAAYWLFKIITFIVYKIFATLMMPSNPRRRKNFFTSRLVGGFFGVLCGAVGAVVFIIPIFGYTNMVADTSTQVVAVADGMVKKGWLVPVDSARETPIAKDVYAAGGNKVFDTLTTAKWEDEEIQLVTEWNAMLTAAENAVALTEKPVEEFDEPEAEAATNMAQSIKDSKVLTYLGADVLSCAAYSWANGENFTMIAPPELNGNAAKIFNGFLKVFATSTRDTFTEDLDTFSKIVELLAKYDAFSLLAEGVTSEELIDHLGATTALPECYAILDANERMKPVKAAITDTGMEIFASQLGSPETYLTTSKVLFEDIATAVWASRTADNQTDVAALTAQLEIISATHGLGLKASTIAVVAQGYADEFDAETVAGLTTKDAKLNSVAALIAAAAPAKK